MDEQTLRKILKEELQDFAKKDDLKNTQKKLEQKIESEVKGSEKRLTNVIEREVEDLSLLITASFEKLDEKADRTNATLSKVKN